MRPISRRVIAPWRTATLCTGLQEDAVVDAPRMWTGERTSGKVPSAAAGQDAPQRTAGRYDLRSTISKGEPTTGGRWFGPKRAPGSAGPAGRSGSGPWLPGYRTHTTT